MRLVFCLLNLCFLFLINEAIAKNRRDILGKCVKGRVGSYYKPMKSCLDKCASDILGAQKQVSECFFDKDINRHNQAVDCVKNNAVCYIPNKKKSKKRKGRDVSWGDVDNDVIIEDGFNPEFEVHKRFVRATLEDMNNQVINEAVNDYRLKAKMLTYRQCKIDCVVNYHMRTTLANTGSSRQRFGRSVKLGNDSYTVYLKDCFQKSNCKPKEGAANKCMPLFFRKQDPKKFCLCLQRFHNNVVKCDRYNQADTTANKSEPPQRAAQVKLPEKNVVNMKVPNSGISASGSSGGNNFFSFSGR